MIETLPAVFCTKLDKGRYELDFGTNLTGWLKLRLRGIKAGQAIVGNLTWVKAHHDSPYGRIVSNGKREGKHLTMDITIPANTTATVYMPGKDGGVREVGPGCHRFKVEMSE